MSAAERSFARKAERTGRVAELEFRECLAAGMPEGMAHYAAFCALFGFRGCIQSDRAVAGDKDDPEEFPGQLPHGRRGKHHPRSLWRWRSDPRFRERYEARRIRPREVLPIEIVKRKNVRSRNGAVWVWHRSMRRAKEREQRKQRRETEKPPGLVEHEERKRTEYAAVTNVHEAMAALGFAARPPPGKSTTRSR